MSAAGMRLLMLGGTAWLGGYVTSTAVERGHQVTCLARGSSGDAPDGAVFVPADRTLDVDVLADAMDRPENGSASM